jgi:hypothetical protein
MVLTGLGIAAATLPWVGVNAWLEWLRVGSVAAAVYDVDFNWVHFSRDLHGIPRRIWIDFEGEYFKRNTLALTLAGWSLWAIVMETTVRFVALKRGRIPDTGPAAAFLFLGAWLTCYHFMYYDALLSALPFALLAAEPRRYLRPVVLTFAHALRPPFRAHAGPPLTPAPDPLRPRSLCVASSVSLTLLVMLILLEHQAHLIEPKATLGLGMLDYTVPTTTTVSTPAGGTATTETWHSPKLELTTHGNYAGDTILLAILWLWCGAEAVFGRSVDPAAQPGDLNADVLRPEQLFADQNGLHAGGAQPGHVQPGADAALADDQPVRRDPGG